MPSPKMDRSDVLRYAILSLVCFVLAVGLFALMFWKVETLAAFGLTGKLFYLVLISMGLAAAAFLFGVLRSVALYRGQAFGGTLKLGGPIILAAMVVWGGFKLPPPEPGTFSTTVFVHGPGGPQDMVLRGRGKVLLDLGGTGDRSRSMKRARLTFLAFPLFFAGRKSQFQLMLKALNQRRLALGYGLQRLLTCRFVRARVGFTEWW